MEVHVDDIIHNVVVENFHDDPFKLAKKRLHFFKRWQERARVIEQEGDSFLAKAPAHAKQILKGKRLQLWDEILKDLQYADDSLVSDITSGFESTGGCGRRAFSRRGCVGRRLVKTPS